MTTIPVSSSSNSNPITSKGFALKTEDFIKMMITQLQNQDPLEPAKNQELLAQMSQIGQLQSTTMLQDNLKAMTMQNQIGSASSLIGKVVTGLDDQSKLISGLVMSVKIEGDTVSLELDSGKSILLARVASISPMWSTSAA